MEEEVGAVGVVMVVEGGVEVQSVRRRRRRRRRRTRTRRTRRTTTRRRRRTRTRTRRRRGDLLDPSFKKILETTLTRSSRSFKQNINLCAVRCGNGL